MSALDLAVQLWRARWLMTGVFLPVLAIGLLGAMALPEQFRASSRIVIAPPTSEAEAAVRLEAALLRSPAVAEAALTRITLARVYPDISRRCRPDTCLQAGVERVAEALSTQALPHSLVISASFEHSHASMSAEMLNALIDAYVAYREDVFQAGEAQDYSAQKAAFEKDVAEAEAAVRAYLIANGLSSLAAERDTLQQLRLAASNELLQTQSRLRQAEAQLEVHRQQIEEIDPEIDLFVEDASRKTLLDLKLEREEKLLYHAIDSSVIQDLDRRIERAEALIDTGGSGGVVRRGPNPLYQQVAASVAALEAEFQSLEWQGAELQSQIATFGDRQRQLVEMEPGLLELERRRDAAAETARAFVVREADERARTELSRGREDAIRVIEPARAPLAAESLRLPGALLAIGFAVLSALIAGLVWAFTRSGFATPGAVERTLGVPVVATIQTY